MTLKNTSGCLGFSQLTSIPSAVSLMQPADMGKGPATLAIIQVETQGIRWRDDGVNPTAGVGMLISGPGVLQYDGDLTQFKMIQTASGTIVNIAFYN